MQSDNTAELSAALAKAQAEMKAATFNKTNPHFKNKYADLAAVLEAIRKPLADNNLSTTQTMEIREGGLVLVTTLRHATGQWIASEYPLPVNAKPQELGSALTYARRYSLSAIACIAADEDDDAEGARQGDQVSSAPKPRSPVRPQVVEPPVDPETGECSPHVISANGAANWGGLFIAAIGTATSEEDARNWIIENREKLDKLKEAAPKVHEHVESAINKKLASFNKEAA